MTPETFFANFGHLAEAPNGVQKLRELMLQLAVQGKLVPQDLREGDGHSLLKLLEKENLSSNTKTRLSKGMVEPEFIWDAPNTWAFTSLESVSRGKNGLFSDGDWVESKDQDPNGSIRLIQLADVGDGRFLDKSSRFMTSEAAERLNCTFLSPGDILIARMPAPLGRACIFPGDAKQSVTVVDVCILRPNQLVITTKFAMLVINSAHFRYAVLEKATGTTRSRISRGNLSSFPMPLPPLAEQYRIVAKVDQLMALCDELEERQQRSRAKLTRLNNATLDRLLNVRETEAFTAAWRLVRDNFELLYTTPETITKLRQAILQLAVQGKLVPQDPNDEPASVLLARIKAEKERLVKEKKIRKSEPLPPVSASEAPYVLPKGWEWVAIGEVAIIQGGKRLPAGASFSVKPTNRIYIQVTNMKNGTIINENLKYIDEAVFQEIKRYIINKEDVYITIAGTIGQPGEVPEMFDGMSLTENAAKLVFSGIYKKFLLLTLQSETLQVQFKDKTNQLAQPKLALKRIADAFSPLPPLAEQHRIVAKVDQLMALCDKLEANLTKSQAKAEKMATAAVKGLIAA